MPRVKIDYVVSFSSESPEAPASNLLASEAGRGRWLCARGEPSSSVLLQLPKAVQISSITIGAHLAALVEVLVGRSETPNDAFQVLVASSVFLSPIESRRATEGDTAADKVRTFNTDQLSADIRSKRWDRVRVVCSQPYNKHCKYGLSFIHIFSPESDIESKETKAISPKQTTEDSTTAKPALKLPLNISISPQDSDEDEFKPGALFAQHRAASQSQSQDSSQSTSGSTESQIRKATSQAIKNVFNSSSTKIVRTPISKPKHPAESTPDDRPKSDRTREKLMYDDDDDSPNDKIDRLVAAHKDQQAKNSEKASKEREKQHKDKEKTSKEKPELESSKHKHRSKDDSSHNSSREKYKDKPDDRNKTHSERDKTDNRSNTSQSSKRERDRSSKGRDDERNVKKQKTAKDDTSEVLYAGPVSTEPHTLLRDVVFVLSGYENPRRAKVRDAALAMGATFQRDWGPSCTHLICAFSNTPKLKTVRSSPNGDRAIVVTAEWIERQAARCRRLPWQWFATENKNRVHRARAASGEDPPGTSAQSTQDNDDTGQNSKPNRDKDTPDPESECDTDDEIERVMRKNAQKRVLSDEEESPKKKTKQDLANTSSESDVAFVRDERIQGNVTISDSDGDATDKEDATKDTVDMSTIDALPSFFEGCTFAVHAANRPLLDEKLVRRYVKAYGGEIVEALDDEETIEVDYVLCLSGNTEGVRAKGTKVRGDWVWKCHERRRLCQPGEFAL